MTSGRERLIAQGTPEQFASFALEIFTASRRGEFAAVDSALKQLLGREPTRFRDVLAASVPRSAAHRGPGTGRWHMG